MHSGCILDASFLQSIPIRHPISLAPTRCKPRNDPQETGAVMARSVRITDYQSILSPFITIYHHPGLQVKEKPKEQPQLEAQPQRLHARWPVPPSAIRFRSSPWPWQKPWLLLAVSLQPASPPRGSTQHHHAGWPWVKPNATHGTRRTRKPSHAKLPPRCHPICGGLTLTLLGPSTKIRQDSTVPAQQTRHPLRSRSCRRWIPYLLCAISRDVSLFPTLHHLWRVSDASRIAI